MALIAHQIQGSYSTSSLRPQLWTKGVKLRSFVAFDLVRRADELMPLKHRFHLRGRTIVLPKGKLFRVSSFKGNSQSDEADGIDVESKFSKKTVQLSCTPQETEEIIRESSDVSPHPLSYSSEDKEDIAPISEAMQKLFKKWLVMLRTQTLSKRADEVYRESPVQSEISENQLGLLRQRVGIMLKAALVYFMGLDVTIKVPLLMFVPGYLTARVLYGVEVTKELTPLWVLGPLIVALYIKIIQGVVSLYIFCFKQTVKLIKNLPTYYLLVYSYIAEGKLRAYLWGLFFQPIVDIITLDYIELFRQRVKQLKEMVVEKYLDYVESIWPYYCRTIRFLKKANLL